MGCLSLGWLEQLLIWLVVIAVIVAIVRLLLPHILGPLGEFGSLVQQILYLVIWAVVAIAFIILVFDLLSCAVGLPRLRP